MSPSLAVTEISELITNDTYSFGGMLGSLTDAALVIENGVVVWVGESAKAPAADQQISAEGAPVLPGFVDSHAHPVFAGDRAKEFEARMLGERYAAGGIRTTVAATRAASDEALSQNLAHLQAEFHASGITTFEAKSGYGLNVVDEARSLRLAKQFTQETTFLGAHVVPTEYENRADDYVRLVTGEMLQEVRPHARWIDVFLERGAFDVDQSREILLAGRAAGLLPRLHSNQLSSMGGIELAAELQCASVDHCSVLSANEIDILCNSNVVATLLPGAEFSTRSAYPPARALLDGGATVALATDCNPGSSYTSSILFVIALAVREMRMSPAEAIRAATVGGARALQRADVGHLGVGARADFVILDAPSYLHIPYRPGVPLVAKTFVAGERVY